ncbi:MAG: 50S ribosomal protein L23 [Candidatus Jorgensenbacteria bacterium]|nr:50S ribosomal protein L23 [Candidatus Jorgensenbacteria bacterium]
MSIFTKNKPKEKENQPVDAVKKQAPIASVSGTRSRITKSIILKPHISEKAAQDEANGRYVFLVTRNAKKPEIKKEIQERYGVKVSSVNTVIKKGRETHWRGKAGKKPIIKKAIVTLAAGQKIEN